LERFVDIVVHYMLVGSAVDTYNNDEAVGCLSLTTIAQIPSNSGCTATHT
jgi:hypothetical protein